MKHPYSKIGLVVKLSNEGLGLPKIADYVGCDYWQTRRMLISGRKLEKDFQKYLEGKNETTNLDKI